MVSAPSFFRALALTAAVGVLLLTGRTAQADTFDDMRQAWFVHVTGGAEYAPHDPVIVSATQQLDGEAGRDWDALKAAKPFGATCFADVAFGKSPAVTEAYKRLNAMARAYWARGGAYGSNPSLRADIIAALDWMYANQYNENIKEFGNWWDWEIGCPLNLKDIVVMMYDFLSPTQIANYMKPIDRFALTYTGGRGGANGAWVAIVTAVRAVVVKDPAKLQYARDKLSELTTNVRSGDGFYNDGSYIGHGYFCYNGGYGLYFLQSLADGYYLMGPNSAYPLPADKRAIAYGWVKNSYWPLMYRGQMPYFSIGREVGRGPSGNRSGTVAFSIVQLVGADTSGDARLLLQMAKRIFVDGGDRYGTGLGEIVKLQALMADPAIAPLPDANGTTIFAVVDKTVALRPEWGVGIAYYSTRTHNYEDAGENKRGWHQSDGMVYVNNADADQYNGAFWPTVDSHHLAGTTVTQGVEESWGRANGDAFAGGAELNRAYAAVGFTLKPGYGQTLVANKAWFVFDDAVACLGSGITSTGGKEIETIIENRKLRPEGTNALTIDGAAQPVTLPWTANRSGAHWMHLAGSVPGSDIGYVFPGPTDLALVRETRTGSWSAIHTGSSPAPVTESYLSAVTSQGTDPANGSYAYILLPNRTAAETAAYAAQPAVTLLANTADVSAARQSRSGVTGAIFWKDGTASLALPNGATLRCDRKAAIVLREAQGQIDVSVSDPTQANAATIEIEYTRSVRGIVAVDPGITIIQQTPTLKLSVAVKGAKGKTFHARFTAE